MPSFRIDQLDEMEKWMKGSFAGGARRGLLSAAMRGIGVIQNELIPAADPQPVDIGAYRAGWQVEPHADGVDLVNTLPYAPIIEYGARAENIKIGRKMIDALEAWAVRKGIAGEEDARSTAWAIAKSMQARGIFNRGGDKGGLRIGEKAIAKIREFLPVEILREVKKMESK